MIDLCHDSSAAGISLAEVFHLWHYDTGLDLDVSISLASSAALKYKHTSPSITFVNHGLQ